MGLAASAQTTGKITGKIKDGGDQHVIDGATVSLVKAKDSSLVKVALTDKEGNYSFDNVKEGAYLVKAGSPGHSTIYSAPLKIGNDQATVEVGIFQLQPVNKNLSTVTVVAKKQLIERKIDRTIINVDAAITNAGTTAMEVLEKSPGITVDKDGNISLKGKQGVMVMLDGKPSYLNQADLTNLLKTMPSSGIDQIEIMTNPPAKYDAAGNSGVINIKLKKNRQKGLNGNLSLSFGQGKYSKTNNSASLNYRQGKWNLFSSVSANYRESFQMLDIRRRYLNNNGSLNAIFEQQSRQMHFSHNYNARAGADFYASKRTTFGLLLSGFTTPEKQVGYNTSYLKSNQGIVDSIVTSSNNENNKWRNGAINFNFKQLLDSVGTELTADVDYISYRAGKEQLFQNLDYTSGWTLKNKDELSGDLPTKITIQSVKADLVHPLSKKTKLEAGLKSSTVKTNNSADYFNLVGNTKQPDYEKTNHFIYKENINAAYANLSGEYGKWGIQAGLRLENTNYNGLQYGNPQRTDSAFKRSYTGLFPTLFLSFQANAKNQFGFSYGRRINRPDYEDLNPFLFFIDKYTYGGGNPFLKPSYANSIELSHTYRQFLTTTVNYTHTRDLFADMFEQKGYATLVKKGNFGTTDVISTSVNAQLPFKKWWSSNVYAEYNFSSYSGLLNGENFKLHGGNLTFNVNNQFRLGKGWSAELSGFYRTKGIEGQIIVNPLGNVNAGIQKLVLKNKGTIKVSIRDIFYTQPASGDINFQRTEAHFNQNSDTRVANFSFTYRFGKPIKGAQKRKTGGAGDEQNRVKGLN